VTGARLLRVAALASLPAEWPADVLPDIREMVGRDGRTVVVLDDDPTGTQTVHGVPVLTDWSVESLESELAGAPLMIFILTNSRSVSSEEAQAMNREIGHRLVESSHRTGRPFVAISRSDSTLRGHFPTEVQALADALGQHFDAWLLVPAFLEGGRYTLDDIHYVAEGDHLLPAAETEFARDAAFGYQASNLRQWVEEKTKGRVLQAAVASIAIDDIRRGGPERVAERLIALTGGVICIANAASRRDLEVLALGALIAEGRGRRFLYRTAASFVAARTGLSPRPLLNAAELGLPRVGGGLIIIGSHVPRTTDQLHALSMLEDICHIEVNVTSLVDDCARAREIRGVVQQAESALRSGADVAISTSRALVTTRGSADCFSIAQRVSHSLATVVRTIRGRPRYLLAKGGITSSDVATKGLGVRRAVVEGQIFPGVPAWRLGPESRHPGLVYIVFPGNVGGPRALAEVVAALRV
jgi:uncharacterized protein YgbK (DUF1537 family)